MVTDYRKRPRRRGDELISAILAATLAELAECGYAGLTVERVADRAKASKASLYRRWSSRAQLVMEAVYSTIPDPASPADTGSLRGDLLALVRGHAEHLGGPVGEAMRGVIGEALRDEDRAAELRGITQGAGLRAMREITRRAAERSEIDGQGITERQLEAGIALLRQYFLANGVPIPDSVVVGIVDEVMLPLFTKT